MGIILKYQIRLPHAHTDHPTVRQFECSEQRSICSTVANSAAPDDATVQYPVSAVPAAATATHWRHIASGSFRSE